MEILICKILFFWSSFLFYAIPVAFADSPQILSATNSTLSITPKQNEISNHLEVIKKNLA